jgi:HlyD family secretion protein
MRNTRIGYRATAVVFALMFTSALMAGCGKKGASGGGTAGGAHSKGPQSVTVEVTPVKLGTIAQVQEITGNIAALEDSTISARVAARVSAVYVREGDTVKAGQVLVQQDTNDLQANVQNAQAQVVNAQATLAQNVTNYQIQVIQAKQNVENAEATLRASQFAYSKAKQGSRPQQVLEGKSSVDQAKATADNAYTTLQRDQYLYSQGALDAADLQTAQTTYAVDEQQYKNAQAALSLTVAGNYTQDIASAKEQVRESETNLVNQKANEKQILLHKQEIQAAQASVNAANATLAYDQEQVQYATIRAPFNGIVATRDAEPGQVAAVGAALIEVVNVSTCYFEPTVSELFYGDVNTGDKVQVRCDALPGKTFVGRVAAVFPSANTNTRVFSLRVDVPNPQNQLRPGMYARGRLTTAVHNNVVVIPQSALVTQAQTGLAVNTTSTGEATGSTQMPDQQVMLAGPDGKKAVAQPVTIGLVAGNDAEITKGLKPGDQLITTGAGLLTDGQAITIAGQHGGQHHPSQTAQTADAGA